MKRNIIFLCLLFFGLNVWSQNLALNKSYTLSTSPDYAHTAPSSDKTSLTDGIYSKGYFWTQKTTVGWAYVPKVIITIDLGEEQQIGAVSFNTVRQQEQYVNFPKNIFVFISKDNESFQYVGNAARDTGNVPGPYLIKKFFLNNIRSVGRYVRLSVIPDGVFLFCDEIEVLKGDTKLMNQGHLISRDNLSKKEDSLENLESLRGSIEKSIDKLENRSEKSDVSNSKYKNIHKQLENQNISENDLNNLKKEIALEHVSNTRQLFQSSYLVQSYNPWDTLSQFYIPTQPSKSLQYTYYIPVNGAQYGAFLLMNNSTVSKTFKLKIKNISSFTGIDLFSVPFVPSINYEEVPDPLLPIKGSISLSPGNTEMIIFKLLGLKQGSSNINIAINSDGEITKADINAQVIKIPVDSNTEDLNANVWAYFTNPMIRERKEQAAADLREHHINTIVIPPAVLPMVKTTDYSGFGNYLSNFKEVKNFLLFMNYTSLPYRNSYQNGQFLSPEWKAKFIDWYNKITSYIKQNGFPNSKIYLYPYDEISGKDFHDFKDLIGWAKSAIPGIKFYATLNNQNSIDSILPIVDIAQILPSLTKQLPNHHCEIWIYTTNPPNKPSRDYSPYSFYRLKAWDAFVNGYKGIGFWNYADERNSDNLNLVSGQFLNLLGSYSVIYNDSSGNIISSRRWEGFRLGIEDYSILQAYSKIVGIAKAKSVANSVLSNSGNTNLADSSRLQMVKVLLGLK